ncbi:hypothetical protein FF125_21280 [Aureibaculum algae]|uniref:Uncharacterized protein n=1 Tax=Aureibaculum algae TaxID=2584122 RepID=A0A5B7U1K8_9FLAO|nr:hypothetical protein [Aureibaculum algae]QCX40852.1 hypothetical protein FF125_21280 [Aureibaculum algae]
MLKKSLSIILLIVFVNFILTPTIISLLDSSNDISSVFSLNEEEKKGSEVEKDVKIKIFQNEDNEDSIIEFALLLNQRYGELSSNFFPKLHLPPPEFS